MNLGATGRTKTVELWQKLNMNIVSNFQNFVGTNKFGALEGDEEEADSTPDSEE